MGMYQNISNNRKKKTVSKSIEGFTLYKEKNPHNIYIKMHSKFCFNLKKFTYKIKNGNYPKNSLISRVKLQIFY